MLKYTKELLTVIALCVLALPVKAEEKVWRCEMTAVSSSRQPVDSRPYKGEKFRMRVTNTQVVFDAESHFNGATMPIVNIIYSTEKLIEARSAIGYLWLLEDGRHVMFNGVTDVIQARCEDF